MRNLSCVVLALALAAGAHAADGRTKRTIPTRSATATWANVLTSTPSTRKWRGASSWRMKWRANRRSTTIRFSPSIVNRIGQNLVRNSDAKVPFTFRVIDGDEVNAFALPGGLCFRVYRPDENGERRGRIRRRRGARDRPRGGAPYDVPGVQSADRPGSLGSIPGGWGGLVVRVRQPLAVP